jgi:UbiD family decarboxylase
MTTANPSNPRPSDLREWLDLIERQGQLSRIKAEVDPVEELSAITYLASREPGSPAFLFESVKGDRIGGRVLTNMLAASKERYALAVGLNPDLSSRQLVTETRKISSLRKPPVMVPASAAPVREITLSGDEIDLADFPAPKFWPGDGGRFIGTGNITFTSNPETGVVNAGVYRQMMQGPRSVGLNMVPGRHGARNVEAWWRLGKPAPIVTAYGVDPALFIAATQAYAHEESELDVAGGLAGVPMQITAADLSDLPIPATAEIVVEGFVHEGDMALLRDRRIPRHHALGAGVG